MQVPEIKLEVVKSSQIFAIGHDGETTLAIQFKDEEGRPTTTYHYKNIPREMYVEMKMSESVGSFFYKRIKYQAIKHPYQKIK